MDIFVASPWGAGMQTNKCAQTFTFDAFVDASLDPSSTLKWKKKSRLQRWGRRHRLLCKTNIYEALITIDKQTPFGNVAETCRIWLGMLEVPTLCNLAVQMFELVWIRQPLIVGRCKGAFMKMETWRQFKICCDLSVLLKVCLWIIGHNWRGERHSPFSPFLCFPPNFPTLSFHPLDFLTVLVHLLNFLALSVLPLAMYVCQHVNFCRSGYSWFWYHRSRYHDLRYLDQSSSFAALCGC